MLKLTKKADYGLIALKHLAVSSRSASAKEIADAYGIPLPLLAKILQKLTKTGLLLSVSGSSRIQILRRCESCPIQGLRSAKAGKFAAPKRRASSSPVQSA